MSEVEFIAEIVEIKQTKSVDLEHNQSIKFRTEDVGVITLAAVPPDKTVKVKVSYE